MRDHAIEAAQARVARFRELARKDPFTYEPELGIAIYALCMELRDRPGPVTSSFIELCEEGIALHRRSQHTHPGSLLALGFMLGWLAIAQFSLGSSDKARVLIEESLALMRRLVREGRTEHRPDLCRTLSLTALALGRVGDHRGALNAAEEAVALRRQIVKEAPHVHDAELAGTLHTLCLVLQDAGQRQEMLAPAEESVRIMRRLRTEGAASASDAGLLATGLDLVVAALDSHERWQDAVPVAEEAVTWHQQAQREGRQILTLGYATSLGNCSRMLANVGRRSDAKTYAQEAAIECIRRCRDTGSVADLSSASARIEGLLSEHGMTWYATLLRKSVARRLDPRPRGLRRFLGRRGSDSAR